MKLLLAPHRRRRQIHSLRVRINICWSLLMTVRLCFGVQTAILLVSQGYTALQYIRLDNDNKIIIYAFIHFKK